LQINALIIKSTKLVEINLIDFIMKNRMFVLAFLLVMVGTQFVVGQENSVLDGGVYKKIHVSNRKAVSLQTMREADVMWSKTLWRRIDLRE